MENASKALLIAAAILIAIILISLGLIVINQGRTAIDEAGAGVSEVSIQAFNSKFQSYLGSNVSGTKVRSLIDTINSNNNANVDDPYKTIYVRIKEDNTENGPGVTSTSPNRSSIEIGKTYQVVVATKLDSANVESCKDPLHSIAKGKGYVNGYIHWIVIIPNP